MPDQPWIHRLDVALKVISGALLLWVRQGRPEQLGTLVRGLRSVAPGLSVEGDVSAVDRLPPGSTFVLIPRPGDAAWLNLRRPVISRRALRIILWTDPQMTDEMSSQAIDFVDWATRSVDCPAGPPRFAVAGLRAAVCSRMPVIPYAGANLDTLFAEALPGRTLARFPLPTKYEQIIEVLQQHADSWVAVSGVGGRFGMRRLLWAMAEAGRRGRVILDNPAEGLFSWAITEAVVDLDKALDTLTSRGITTAGRWVSLLDAEPAAVDAVAAALDGGMVPETIGTILETASDPGAELARLGSGPPLPLQRKFSRNEGGTHDTLLSWARSEPLARATAAIREHHDLEVGKRWFHPSAPTDDASSLLLQSTILVEQGNYGEAEVTARQSLAVQKRTVGEEHPEYAASLHQLSIVLKSQGKYEEAEQAVRRSLAIKKNSMGEEHPGYASSLHQLSIVLKSQGKYEEAEQAVRRSLAIFERTVGEDHPEYATSLHQLSIVLGSRGKYEEAEQVARRSLDLQERTVGEEHPSYATSLHQLSMVLMSQGKYEEAEQTVRRSLTLKARTVGEEHPGYAISLHQLAVVLESQGKYDEAEQAVRRSLTLFGHKVGEEHPDYAILLHQLSIVLESQGKYEEAEQVVRRSLAIQEHTVGDAHPNYATSLHQLSIVLESQGKYEEAEHVLRRSLAFQERTVGEEHPNVLPSLTNLAGLVEKQGRPQEALELLERAAVVCRRTLGLASPEAAQILSRLALLQARLDRPEAKETARQALALLAHFAPDDPVQRFASDLRGLLGETSLA